MAAAQRWAAARGAQVSLIFVDRETGERSGFAEAEPILTASVAELLISSQLAFATVTGARSAMIDDDARLAAMLSASDDGVASVLWAELGGPAIVEAVAQRYGLTGTAPPTDGLWWHTRTTVADIAAFYGHLLDEQGSAWADRILGPLGAWTDTGADGYDQRFGLAAVAPDLVALKQGWMCCVGDQWIHLTTGVFGPGGRYILAVQVAEDVQYSDGLPPGLAGLPQTSAGIDVDDASAAHARDTMTGVVAALFPERVRHGLDFAGPAVGR